MSPFESYMTRPLGNADVLKRFRHALYAVVLYLILILALPLHELIWGPESLIPQMGFPERWTNRLVMFLHYPGNESWYPLFFLLPFLGILVHWRSRFVRLGALLVYVGVLILFNRAYLMLVGGNYLLHLLLFYLLFIDERNEYEGTLGQLSRVSTRFGYWACRIQVCMVYAFSGGYKLISDQWRSGEAIYDITHLEEFSLPWFAELTTGMHGSMVVLNYLAMAYFLSFPVLVWFKRVRLPFLFLGEMLHLSMGVIIGVMDFSLVMMASYIVFLEQEDLVTLRKWFTKQRVDVKT